MNVQNINNAASWADFVRLVQQARSRSMANAAGIAKGGGLQPAQRAVAHPRYVEHAARPEAAPVKTAKIAGGLFDAYA